MKTLGLWFICAAAVAARAMAQKPSDRSISPLLYPDWCVAQPVSVQPGKEWQLWSFGRTGTSAMRAAAGRLRYAIEKGLAPENKRPLYAYQLARHFAELDENAAALAIFRWLAELPDSTPFSAASTGFSGLPDLRSRSRVQAARMAAREGRGDEARRWLAAEPARRLDEALGRAEIHALLNDIAGVRAQLAPLRVNDAFDALKAACIARACGLDDLARSFIKPLRDAGKLPPAIQELAKSLEANMDQGPATLRWRNGEYRGQSHGYIGPVEVSVRIAGGRIAAVEVVRQSDDRPWSAFEQLPRRIIARQSLRVDTVTGATVSSCAVWTAVDRALLNAGGADPSTTP